MKRALILFVLVSSCGGRVGIVTEADGPLEEGWEEIRTEISTGYFRATKEEIDFLAAEGFDDRDGFVALFGARYSGVPVRDVVALLREKSDFHYLALKYVNVPLTEIFVDRPNGSTVPENYKNAYRKYWNRYRQSRYSLTNRELRSLVDLRIAVDYYGISVDDYFSQYTELRKTRSYPFYGIIRKNAGHAGRGGRDSLGKPLQGDGNGR